MTVRNIEIAIINCIFPPFQFFVIPNVKDGLDLDFEADLLVITKAGWAYEIEIKTSISDTKADQKKCVRKMVKGTLTAYNKYKHEEGKPQSKYIKGFYYAYPKELHEKILSIVPEYAGLISVYKHSNNGVHYARFERKATFQKAEKFPEWKIEKAVRLMQIKYWNNVKILEERKNERV